MDKRKPRTTDETEQVERVGFYSFLVNLALAGLKAVLTGFSSSVAVVASTVDSATDTLGEKKAKGTKVGQWLLQHGMDRLYTEKNLAGSGADFVLSDAGVEVMLVQEKTLAEIRKEWQVPASDDQAVERKTQIEGTIAAAEPTGANNR